MTFWTQTRVRWTLTFFSIIGACVFLYAQGQPVSIQQLGTGTAVTTTLPVSGTIAATQSGTWTVQPGNTANTTAWKVDGSAVTQPVSGTVTANQGGSNWSTNVAQFGGTNITTGTGAGGAGIPRVTISNDSSLAANQSVNVAQINGVAPLMGNGATGTGSHRTTVANDNTAVANWGQGATGSAVPSGAQYQGAQARTSLPSAGSNGNQVGLTADKFGRQVFLPYTIRDLTGTQTTTLSATTSETTIVTAAASTFNDLIMLIVSNTSASTNTRIDFRDTTGGSVLFSLFSVGGSPPTGFSLPLPIPQTSSNTNWTAQCATSTTDVRIYAVFAKNQ